MIGRLLAPTLLALLALAAPASAGWGADRAQTRAGTVARVHAAGGNGDRVALTWTRSLGGEQRAEMRLGRARDGLVRVPAVLDTTTRAVEAPLATYVRDGAFAVAWLRGLGPNVRLRYRTADRAGRLGPKINATTTGSSAFEPAWVPGQVPALLWSRTTRSDALELAPTGPRGVRLPSAPRSEPGAAGGGDGLRTVAWVNDERVLVSDRGAGGFGAPFVLAAGDVNRTRVVRVGGATLVLWRQGTELTVAARPSDGAPFGPPRLVLAGTTDIAQVAVTGTGEVLVLAPVGDSSLVGELQLTRLGRDGAALGAVRALGRGRRAQLVADGTGSAFAAWLGERATRAVTARRIAAGGILGPPRRLAVRSDLSSVPALGATHEGGAVLAWVTDGDVHARTYRP